MPYAYGTNNVKIFNINYINIEYTADEPKTLQITADKIEQGISMQHSVGSSVVISSGAELPKSEKVVLSYTVIGSTANMNTLRGIIKKLGAVVSIESLDIFLDNGSFFSIRNPEMSVSRTVKGNDITKMQISCEISGGDADTIMEWSS